MVSSHLVVEFWVCMLLYWSASKSTSLMMQLLTTFYHTLTLLFLHFTFCQSDTVCMFATDDQDRIAEVRASFVMQHAIALHSHSGSCFVSGQEVKRNLE